jgi:hypothetical protein
MDPGNKPRFCGCEFNVKQQILRDLRLSFRYSACYDRISSPGGFQGI